LDDKERQNPQKDFYSQAAEVLGDEFWHDISGLIPTTGPRIDIYHTPTAVFTIAEVPGLRSANQINVFLEGQTLVLEGGIPLLYPVTDNRITQRERFFGSFRRNLPMPKPVSMNGLKAIYSQGLLIVELQIESSMQQTNIPIEFT
jgi:HSP20 family protein